jgi:hypothetical protein
MAAAAELFDLKQGMRNEEFLIECLPVWKDLGIRFSTARRKVPNRGLCKSSIKQHERCIRKLPASFRDADIYSLNDDASPVDDVVSFVEELHRPAHGPYDHVPVGFRYLTIVGNGLQHLHDRKILHEVPTGFRQCYDSTLKKVQAHQRNNTATEPSPFLFAALKEASPETVKAVVRGERPQFLQILARTLNADHQELVDRYQAHLAKANEFKDKKTSDFVKEFVDLAEVSQQFIKELLGMVKDLERCVVLV